jgi:GWxTD domain-containing protein
VSGTIRLPVSRIGIGLTTLVVQRADAPDTVRTPIFVGFSDNLAIGSFEEMLSYLRYFTSPARLQALREAPSDQRGTAWANFLRETDPVLATPEHEGLRDYFSRIEQANERFREEGISGWITDRGMVWVTLGPPDQLYEQGGNDLSQRGRAQIWEYRQFGAELVFVDQTGFGRWKLTPGSEAEFQSIQRRVRSE